MYIFFLLFQVILYPGRCSGYAQLQWSFKKWKWYGKLNASPFEIFGNIHSSLEAFK